MNFFHRQFRDGLTQPAAVPSPDDDYVYNGAHGYTPDEMDMKSIFFANGPGLLFE